MRVNFIRVHPCVMHRLDARRHTVMYEGAHLFLIFPGDKGIQVKVLYQPGYPHGISAGIKVSNRGNPTVAR